MTFETSIEEVNRLKSRPDNGEMLKLYGLYLKTEQNGMRGMKFAVCQLKMPKDNIVIL